MGPRAAVASVLHRYAVFDGRAGRPELWWFVLVQVVVVAVPQWLGWTALVVGAVVGGDVGRVFAVVGGCGLVLGLAVGAVLLVPSLAVGVRRLHDTGRSGLWLLLLPAPYAWLLLVWFLLEDGQPRPNRFGSDLQERQASRPAAPVSPVHSHALVRALGPAVHAVALRRWLQPR